MDGKRMRDTFKARFVTGMFITFPLALTFVVIEWLFGLLDKPLGHILSRLIGREVPGLGLALTVLIVFGVGVVATTVFGRKLFDWTERFIMTLPVLKSFYSTFKQLGDAFSPDNMAAFKKFVIVEYPRKDTHSFGFLTKECTIKSLDGVDEHFYTVYIPTNHLYLGDICLFRKEEVIVSNIPIEDGIRIILSAGISAPNAITRTSVIQPVTRVDGTGGIA